MEFFGMAITILAAILTYQAWKNGRWMKQAHQDTQDLIREMHRDTADTLKKMDDTTKEMQKRTDESFRKMDDTQIEMQKRTDDTLREIARLIAAEGEKTRQAVN